MSCVPWPVDHAAALAASIRQAGTSMGARPWAGTHQLE
ncbi:hypothetical protein CSC42_6919 [Pseudomonas aeruginosa]|nr:hypothetical protein CSC42_6919 [Pseudomonas aeruginosa]